MRRLNHLSEDEFTLWIQSIPAWISSQASPTAGSEGRDNETEERDSEAEERGSEAAQQQYARRLQEYHRELDILREDWTMEVLGRWYLFHFTGLETLLLEEGPRRLKVVSYLPKWLRRKVCCVWLFKEIRINTRIQPLRWGPLRRKYV